MAHSIGLAPRQMSEQATAASIPEMPNRSRRPLVQTVADVAIGVLCVAGMVISAWSLTHLMTQAHVPTPVAVLAFAVLDLPAIVAGLMVYERRHQPHTAAGAQLVLLLAVALSAAVSATHGATMDGGSWMVAVVLGAAPVAFEVAFALRHRSFAVLVWLLWGQHAARAMRRDVWEAVHAVPMVKPAASVAAGPVHALSLASVATSAQPLPVKALAATSSTSAVSVRVSDPGATPTTLAAGVRELYPAVNDPEVLATELAAMLHRPVTVESVKREIRRQR
ncbi:MULTISPECIES: hypothetical protein [unclassified Streptomyces]|uniref:hypothetical protein n=1 Tax=unclassified Streptomyces TaxID=2593676 RepID=UPI00365247D9